MPITLLKKDPSQVFLKNYKIIISYDGTHYAGWQVQPNGLSVQEVLQNTLHQFLQEKVQVTGSGRTDAGVHALGQTAHFHFPKELDTRKFLGSANALLPGDIRILDILEVPIDFHARYSAVSKCYHYHLWLERFQSPFDRLYSYHVKEKIDLQLLRTATNSFIGTHDFKAFANSAESGAAAHDSIRTLYRIDMIERPGGYVLQFEGDGFLYKMVRNLVGTLLDVAKGKIPLEHIPSIIESRDRRLAGQAAPPHGLFLASVKYNLTSVHAKHPLLFA